MKEANLSQEVTARVLGRTDLSSSAIGEEQRSAIAAAGDVLLKSGVIKSDVDVKAAVAALVDTRFSDRLWRTG